MEIPPGQDAATAPDGSTPDVHAMMDSPVVFECEAGAKKCSAGGDGGMDSIVTCDSSGHWQTQACAQQTPVCCAASVTCIATTSCCTTGDCKDLGQVCAMPGGKCACPAATYNALADSSKWQTFDVSTVDPQLVQLSGGAFDGKHLYLVNGAGYGNGKFPRYDTTALLTSSSSWEVFDALTVDSNIQAFYGAAFDRRFVYFVPSGPGGSSGLVTRYDTKASWVNKASWEAFDVAGVNSLATGFGGAATDDRYVYFVPSYNNGDSSGTMARYDTSASFNASGSWSTFDLTTVDPLAKNFAGAAFDGRYLYVGSANSMFDNNAWHGTVARYDTTASFDMKSSWSTFDTETVANGASGYNGTIFDGRYVYFIPSYNQGGCSGVIARYDTTKPFASTTSWESFDTRAVSSGAIIFQGGTFDGRYIYLVPSSYGCTYHGNIVRYDTTAAFGTTNSWEIFDIASLSSEAVGFLGAVFDGRYVYLVPHVTNTKASGLLARFDAKSPACLPTGWHHSFF